MRLAKATLVSTARDGATIQPPLSSLGQIPKKGEKFTVVYLVRSYRTYARIRSLTTGTFNLVVKDRIAVRQSGANSVQANPHKANPTVLETLQPYVRRKTLSTSASRRISTRFPHWERRLGWAPGEQIGSRGDGRLRPSSPEPSAQTRAAVWPSALDRQRRRLFGARRSGRQKIEKRTCFGGPCFEGTLQKPTSVSESSPVAGTIWARHALSNH